MHPKMPAWQRFCRTVIDSSFRLAWCYDPGHQASPVSYHIWTPHPLRQSPSLAAIGHMICSLPCAEVASLHCYSSLPSVPMAGDSQGNECPDVIGKWEYLVCNSEFDI